jgi:hypothetical protein
VLPRQLPLLRLSRAGRGAQAAEQLTGSFSCISYVMRLCGHTDRASSLRYGLPSELARKLDDACRKLSCQACLPVSSVRVTLSTHLAYMIAAYCDQESTGRDQHAGACTAGVNITLPLRRNLSVP